MAYASVLFRQNKAAAVAGLKPIRVRCITSGSPSIHYYLLCTKSKVGLQHFALNSASFRCRRTAAFAMSNVPSHGKSIANRGESATSSTANQSHLRRGRRQMPVEGTRYQPHHSAISSWRGGRVLSEARR